MQKFIVVHGIGDNNPGWLEKYRAHYRLGISPDQVVEFTYETTLNQSRLVKIAGPLLKAVFKPFVDTGALPWPVDDYLNDLVVYFLDRPTRLRVRYELSKLVAENPGCVVVGHSLGSVVAYETLKHFQVSNVRLFTLGSPLSKFTVRCLLDAPKKAPGLMGWTNIYGRFDPIAGPLAPHFKDVQMDVPIVHTHGLARYMNEIAKYT